MHSSKVVRLAFNAEFSRIGVSQASAKVETNCDAISMNNIIFWINPLAEALYRLLYWAYLDGNSF